MALVTAAVLRFADGCNSCVGYGCTIVFASASFCLAATVVAVCICILPFVYDAEDDDNAAHDDDVCVELLLLLLPMMMMMMMMMMMICS